MEERQDKWELMTIIWVNKYLILDTTNKMNGHLRSTNPLMRDWNMPVWTGMHLCPFSSGNSNQIHVYAPGVGAHNQSGSNKGQHGASIQSNECRWRPHQKSICSIPQCKYITYIQNECINFQYHNYTPYNRVQHRQQQHFVMSAQTAHGVVGMCLHRAHSPLGQQNNGGNSQSLEQAYNKGQTGEIRQHFFTLFSPFSPQPPSSFSSSPLSLSHILQHTLVLSRGLE